MRMYGIKELNSLITMLEVVGGFHSPLSYTDDVESFLASNNTYLSDCKVSLNYNLRTVIISIKYKGNKSIITLER